MFCFLSELDFRVFALFGCSAHLHYTFFFEPIDIMRPNNIEIFFLHINASIIYNNYTHSHLYLHNPPSNFAL